MSVIDQVVERYNTIGRFPVAVPEWNTTLYFHVIPSGAIDKAMRGLKPTDEFEININVLIASAETESGEKAFTIADKPKLLRKAEPKVVSRIVEAALNYEPAENDPNS